MKLKVAKMNKNNLLLLLILFMVSLGIQTVHAEPKRSSTVQIGDLIQVNLPGEASLNQGFQVDKRGRINLPEIGPVYVAGYNETQLNDVIQTALKGIFRDVSNASIYVAKQQVIISVQGYVTSPGEYTVTAGSNVQSALYAAGGARSGAQLDQMQLKRKNETIRFNYKAFLDSGDETLLPALQSMDILFIPASPIVGNIEQEFDAAKLANAGDSADSKMAIKVFGEVNAPGSFSYQSSADLVDILMRSGGVTRYAAVEQIRIISNNNPTSFNLKRYLDSGDSSLLPIITPGTTIFVPKQEEEIKAGANMVYVMGEVARPGAFEGKKGATFMDILANAGGPTRFAEARQIRIIKANGVVNRFDLTGYTEGLSQLKPPAIESGDAIFVPEKTDMNDTSWLKVAPERAVNIIGEVVRPGRVEWSDEMNLMDLLAHVGGPTSRADTSRIEIVTSSKRHETFNLDQFIQQGAPSHLLPHISAGAIIRIHDLPQDPSDNKSQWVRQSSDASIYIMGQINSPGRYRFDNSMHFLDILSAADGPNKDADLHNIRITHRNQPYAEVSKLNLALYFETGDDSLLPKVQTGDTIFIPAKDRQWTERSKESTVRVLGAINKPGRYTFDDNMTILDILAEAGGPSDAAYLEKISIVNMSCCQGQARSFDLVEFSRTADMYHLPVLRAGDTIFIPNRSDSFMEKTRSSLDDVIRVTSTILLFGAL
jgi:protein involved in polysaccharide export with SLBB domain